VYFGRRVNGENIELTGNFSFEVSKVYESYDGKSIKDLTE